jgi:hypothetical protein
MDKIEVANERATDDSGHVFEIGAVSEETKGGWPIAHETGSLDPGPIVG